MSDTEKPREFKYPFGLVPPVEGTGQASATDFLSCIAVQLARANQLAEERNAISRETLDLQKAMIEQEQANRARTTYVEPNIKDLTNKVGKEMANQIRQSAGTRQT